MKNFAFLLLWIFGGVACAQSPAQIYQKYQQAAGTVEVVGYTLSLQYKFVDGTASDRKGKAVLRSTGDGTFDFYGRQDEMATSFMMIDGVFYTVDHNNKSYTKQKLLLPTALGSPGGQMVMRDLVNSPDNPEISMYEQNSQSIVIRLSFPDHPAYGITNHYKLLFLDTKTFLPHRTEEYLTAFDKQQSTMMQLSDMKVNDPALKKFVSFEDQTSGMTEVIEKKSEAPNLAGTVAYGFRLIGLNKEEIHLEDLKGKVVLLDFWDTWCGPCIASMPSVQELSIKYHESGLVVVGILTEGKNEETAKKILLKKSITFANVVSTPEVNKQYKLFAIPRYTLIDRQMNVVFDSEGFSPSLEGEIQKALRR